MKKRIALLLCTAVLSLDLNGISKRRDDQQRYCRGQEIGDSF